MGIKSLNTHAPISVSLSSASRNAGTTNGTAVDTNFANGVRLVFDFGDAGVAGTGLFKLQKSPDNSTWADVTGATTAVLTAAEFGTIESFKTHDRYVRAVQVTAVNAIVASCYIEVFDSKGTPNPL